MPRTKEKLLVVDDEPSIRESLSSLFTEIGYPVRAAEDGFTALIEIRKEIPDIILSDLNMPGMSGFEFLSVVRRRLPTIPVIAMSGAFSGDEVPSGVAADAFYQKGSGIRSLLKILEGLTPPKRMPAQQPPRSAPLWIERNGSDADGKPYVSIICPDCLRSFHQHVDGSLSLVREALCAYCRNPIYYAIVEPVDCAPMRASQRPHNAAKPADQTQLPY
ncbi:MAG: response regulator [Terracidiphilus sp.]|jgi:CheY-like chemotaxis protein